MSAACTVQLATLKRLGNVGSEHAWRGSHGHAVAAGEKNSGQIDDVDGYRGV